MTKVRREPAGIADSDMLLVSLLAERLPSRLSKSSSARSSKVLLRLEAPAGGSCPGGFGGEAPGKGKMMSSSRRRRPPNGVPSTDDRGGRCSHTARSSACLALLRFSSGEPGCESVATETMVRSRSTAEPSGLGAAATAEWRSGHRGIRLRPEERSGR